MSATEGTTVSADSDGKLVVAISSRALFDFEQENTVFDQAEGPHKDRAYMALQLARLDQPAKPGVAFSLVRKLLAFNQLPHPDGAPSTVQDPQAQRAHKPFTKPVDVVILSRNDPVSGMRVFRSASHYGLAIERGSFTRGQPPWRYLKPLHANLFLSTHLSDVRAALQAGVPAAQVYPQSAHASEAHPHEVRIAFDGDAVLFSDEAEQVYQQHGLSAFQRHETEKASQPLLAGPFKPLLAALQRLQQEGTAHMRIRTLMDWNIEVDEAMFLGGLPKGEFLREFEPDFFFDDQTGHIESAARHVPSGHVASGISNPLP
jgi:5'-nucleotidase